MLCCSSNVMLYPLGASGRQIKRFLVQAQTCTHASSLSSVGIACLTPDAIDAKHSLVALP